MKKTTIFCLFMFIVLNFISCSDDTTNNTEFIYIWGNWELESLITDEKEWDLSDWPDRYIRTINFSADSTVDGSKGIGRNFIYLKNDLVRIDEFTYYMFNRKLIQSVTSIIDSETYVTDIVYDFDKIFNKEQLTLTLSNDDSFILIYRKQ